MQPAAPIPSPRRRRPFGRPEGLRSIGAFLACLSFSIVVLEEPVEAGRSALFAAGPRVVAIVASALVACAVFLKAAQEERRIASGHAPAGSRSSWASVTATCGVAILGLLGLRSFVGSAAEMHGEVVRLAVLAIVGILLVARGLRELGRGEQPPPTGGPAASASRSSGSGAGRPIVERERALGALDLLGTAAVTPPRMPYFTLGAPTSMGPLGGQAPVFRGVSNPRALHGSETPRWMTVGMIVIGSWPLFWILAMLILGGRK